MELSETNKHSSEVTTLHLEVLPRPDSLSSSIMEQQYAHQAGSLSSHKQDTGCTTDEGVLQLEQRVHQLNERVQQLNQESTSWMLSPSMAREQTVPTASQRSTETVTNQLPPLQPQFSTVARSFPLNSKRMNKAYLQRVNE